MDPEEGLKTNVRLGAAVPNYAWLEERSQEPGFEFREEVKAGHEERFSEARPLQAKASQVDYEISRYGVAGVKAALGLLRLEETLPRTPRPPVSEAQRSRIERVLNATGLL